MSLINFANKLQDKYDLDGWTSSPSPKKDEKEQRKKDIANQIKIIKQMLDQVNHLYDQSTSDGLISEILTSIYDINYHLTSKNLNYIRSKLDKMLKDLSPVL